MRRASLLVSALLLFFTVPSASGQIQLNTSGHVGIGTGPAYNYQLNVECAGCTRAINADAQNSGYDVYAIYGRGHGAGEANIGVWGKAPTGYGFNYAGYFTGNAKVTNTLEYGSLQQGSDRRFKTDVQDLPTTGTLAKLGRLNPISYRYKEASGLEAAGYANMKLPGGKRFGLVAQELEQVFPRLVSEQTHVAVDPEGGRETKSAPETKTYKAVNYVELVPVLVQAVQEQQAEIERLQQTLESNGISVSSQ